MEEEREGQVTEEAETTEESQVLNPEFVGGCSGPGAVS